jgi:hypothetical protein
MLEVGGQEIMDPQCLEDHIIDYYKHLFGSAKVVDMHLDLDLWPNDTTRKPSFYDNNPHDGTNYCHIIYHNMTQRSVAS